MKSQELPKVSHTKILEVLRSKQLKKSAKDPRQHLFFKVKPPKSSTQLIINYKDLRDNFPYALIDFYESKMKTVSANEDGSQSCTVSNEEKNKKIMSSKTMETKMIKNHSKNNSVQKPCSKQQKIILQGHQNKEDDQDIELIYDYDKYLQDSDRHFKVFSSAFSENQPVQNRYLNDLKNGNNSYAREGRREEKFDVKRKKPRVDYSEQ